MHRGVLPLFVLLTFACGDNGFPEPEPVIEGVVFEDLDGDGFVGEGDRRLEGFVVYLDANENGLRDEGEIAATSDSLGQYRFEDLQPGTYRVRQEVPLGFRSVLGQALRVVDHSQDGRDRTPQIIGGTIAADKEYPFMASVGGLWENRFYHSCGGALISDRFVLTAAHCSEGQTAEEAFVMLGTSDPGGEEGVRVGVRAIHIHPSYDGNTSRGFDAAVWELASRVDLEGHGLSTVDLDSEEEGSFASPGVLATTIGWGRSDVETPLLQEVHLPIVGEERCATAYPGVRSFDTQICAGTEAGGLDSCNGDSGGPLLVRDPTKSRWIHAGITSWGEGCALPGKPGIYARTRGLTEWIQSFMTESSQEYQVTLADAAIALPFPMKSTRRPAHGPIDARWSMSTPIIPDATDGVVQAQRGVAMKFFVFTDSAADAPNFECSIDRDGAQELAAESFECSPGINRVSLASYSDGLYLPTLAIEGAGVALEKSMLLTVGEPSEEELAGSLSAADAQDPDYPDPYYIDYVQLVGLEPGAVSRVEVDTNFAVQLGLYDGDLRSASGGGIITADTGGESAALFFVPEEGKNYLIGVTSLGVLATGGYTLTVVNNGQPEATAAP